METPENLQNGRMDAGHHAARIRGGIMEVSSTTALPPLAATRPGRLHIAFAFLAIALFLYLSAFRDALIDDAYITLRYVKTLAATGTWGFFPGYVSNTATSPLNVLLLTAVTVVTRSPLDAVIWLTLIELLILALLLRGIGRVLGLDVFGWVAFATFVFNPWLMSTLGLESILLTTLVAAVLYALLLARFDAMALSCALLTLTRADGVLLLLVCIWFVPGWRLRIRVAALFLMAVAPWHLFSWIYLGSLVPDTLLLKINGTEGFRTFGDGLRWYAQRYPWQTLLTFVYLPFALLVCLKPVRRLGAIILIPLAYGLLHSLAYGWLRVWPFHWYYIPEIICVVFLGSVAVSVLWREYRHRRPMIGGLVAALALSIPAVGTSSLFVSYGVPLQEAFVHTNWATSGQYRTIGLWLKENHGHDTGIAEVEIGTLAYYCDCLLRDRFGDRSWLTPFVTALSQRTSMRARLARLNFFYYKPQPFLPPPTYTLTVLSSVDKIDPKLPHWRIASRWIATQWVSWIPQLNPLSTVTLHPVD
jgi:hypothetical protein